MLNGVILSSLLGVMRGVRGVPVRDVRVVPGLQMVAGFVMLRGFAVVFGRMLMVLGCLMMMRSACMIRHGQWFSVGEQNLSVQAQGYDPPNSADNQMNST